MRHLHAGSSKLLLTKHLINLSFKDRARGRAPPAGAAGRDAWAIAWGAGDVWEGTREEGRRTTSGYVGLSRCPQLDLQNTHLLLQLAHLLLQLRARANLCLEVSVGSRKGSRTPTGFFGTSPSAARASASSWSTSAISLPNDTDNACRTSRRSCPT